MTCREAAAFVEPFVDGELNVTDTTVLNAHVAICGACAHLVDRQRAWSRVLRQAPRFRAPETLAVRLRATLAHAAAPALAAAPEPEPEQMLPRPTPIAQPTSIATPTPTSTLSAISARRLWIAGLAVAAMLLLSASTTWWLWQTQRHAIPTRTDVVASAVIDSHIRSLMADHLTDVPSSDRHTVKPWFAGKVPYALTVPDLTTDGFTLEGGRLDYVAGRAVAALVYRRRQHVINLFVWPLTSDDRAENTTHRRDGYDAIAWTGEGQQLWAVSDVSDAELRLFVQMFQQRQ